MEKELSSSVHLELGMKKKRNSGQETEVSHGHVIPNSGITRAPRVIRDGKVAVIYQPNIGIGWYSVHKIEALLFAPEIVFMIEQKESGSKVHEYCCSMKYGSAVMAIMCHGLSINWVPVSEEFRIHEYDG
ncbi:hypothetical protein DAPPUDRAFT_227100, partial [Daphnia pulex]